MAVEPKRSPKTAPFNKQSKYYPIIPTQHRRNDKKSARATFRYPFIFDVKGGSQYIIGGIATTMLITETVFSTVIGRFADKIGRKKAFYLLIPFF